MHEHILAQTLIDKLMEIKKKIEKEKELPEYPYESDSEKIRVFEERTSNVDDTLDYVLEIIGALQEDKPMSDVPDPWYLTEPWWL